VKPPTPKIPSPHIDPPDNLSPEKPSELIENVQIQFEPTNVTTQDALVSDIEKFLQETSNKADNS
jgi:hypothetical protein